MYLRIFIFKIKVKSLYINLNKSKSHIWYTLKDIHFSIPNYYRKGNKKGIRPINRLFLIFLDGPVNNNPTMGNWKYLVNGILYKIDPQNPVIQEIYDFITQIPSFDENKLELVIKIIDIFLDDRNFATHKKIYMKEEIETILKDLIPLINEIIEFLIHIHI